MIDRNSRTRPDELPTPQAVAGPGSLAPPYPRGIDGGWRNDASAGGHPVAASCCDELYEGRNYSRRPVGHSRG